MLSGGLIKEAGTTRNSVNESRKSADDDDKKSVTDCQELRPVRSAKVNVSYDPDAASRMKKSRNVKTSDKKNREGEVPCGNMELLTTGVVPNGVQADQAGSMFVREKILMENSFFVCSSLHSTNS